MNVVNGYCPCCQGSPCGCRQGEACCACNRSGVGGAVVSGTGQQVEDNSDAVGGQFTGSEK